MVTINVSVTANLGEKKIVNHVYDDDQVIPVLGKFGHIKNIRARDVSIVDNQLIINNYAHKIVYICQT